MTDLNNIPGVKVVSPIDKWCVHGYYTLCPYAPDDSGRLLFSVGNLETGRSQVYITSKEGEVEHVFGDNLMESNFYHTGCWQTWSPDAKSVYYQSGTMMDPKIIRHDLETGEDLVMDGDMEGAPPLGEPIISGYLGMLYAAGYGDGNYNASAAPIPFEERDKHGLFRHTPSTGTSELVLSINQILDIHPFKEQLMEEDRKVKARLGENEGLTLMAYCVRWSPKGDRCLFYFGNHCVDKKRGEPRLSYVFTADREFKDIHLALDLSFGRTGVHWGWHPDGEHLVGYGPSPEDSSKRCLCTVKYDGTEFKKISKHNSGGHPSISPADHNLLVTDEGTIPGRIVFIDLTTDTEIGSYTLPRVNGPVEPVGRNPFRVCHHPVFNRDATKVLVNTLPGKYATLCELDVINRK